MGKLSKRNILWIIPIGILGVFYYFYGPQKDITDNEYITYVKNYSLETNDPSLEKAFSKHCKDPYWVYFKTQKGQDVVEFKGKCPVEDKDAEVNVQFLVDSDMKDLTLGAMLVNSEQQSEKDRDKFIEVVTK